MTALGSTTAVLSLGPEGMSVEFGATLPPEPAPAPLRVSISRRRTLGRCAKLYYFEYVLGRRPARESHEQVWGAALHRGLEALNVQIKRGYGLETGILAGVLSAALTPGLDSEGRPYAPPADPYARAALRAMLRAYAAVWGESDAARYEVVAVELPFDLPVLTARGRESKNGYPGHRMAARRVGRIDAVVRELHGACPLDDGNAGPCHGCRTHGTPGPVWAVEHKSTSMPPGEDVYYKGIEVDLQLATYFDALTLLGHAPAGVLYDVVRRPDYHEPKPAPKLTKSGKPRAARTVECDFCEGDQVVMSGVCPTCEGRSDCADCGSSGRVVSACPACSGTGRVTATVVYSNPIHGESASAYEERIYRLATGADETTPEAAQRRVAEWFGRREFKAGEGPLTSNAIQDARADLHAAALEIRWRERTGLYPRPGDRYVCAPPGRRPPCAWLDVCAGRESATDDRLYPLKIKREGVEL